MRSSRINDPAQAVSVQRLTDAAVAGIASAPRNRRGALIMPLPPDLIQKLLDAERAREPGERFAQQAEKVIHGELVASRVKK
jgi:hypothetical protein